MVSRVLHLVKPDVFATEPAVPPIVHTLAEVEKHQRLLTTGALKNRAAVAAMMGTSRARVTQLFSLLKLHPDILAHVRHLPAGTPPRLVTERGLRPLALLPFNEQLKRAAGVLPGFAPAGDRPTRFDRV